jgi:hypothetical protein
MGEMCLPGFYIDGNIVKENQEKMMEERMEDMIHETLKSRRSITEAKWHKQEVIVTLMCSECSLGNALFLHTNMVIVRAVIKSSKILSTT